MKITTEYENYLKSEYPMIMIGKQSGSFFLITQKDDENFHTGINLHNGEYSTYWVGLVKYEGKIIMEND